MNDQTFYLPEDGPNVLYTEGRQAVETCYNPKYAFPILYVPNTQSLLIPNPESLYLHTHRPVHGACSIEVDALEFVVVGLFWLRTLLSTYL